MSAEPRRTRSSCRCTKTGFDEKKTTLTPPKSKTNKTEKESILSFSHNLPAELTVHTNLITPDQQSTRHPQTMNQSTIYRRHEARLSRTMALKNDPRPAAVRVLSGLPGFRIFVPPYQPVQASMVEKKDSPVFLEATVFSSHENTPFSQRTSAITTPKIVFAAAIGGAAADLLFGRKSAVLLKCDASRGFASPFRTTIEGGNAWLSFSHSHHAHNHKAFEFPAFRGVAMTTIAATAASTALMFGTKVVVSQRLGDSTTFTSVVSSACAGAVVATVDTPLQAVRSHMALQQQFGVLTSQSPLQRAISLVRSQGASALLRRAPTVYGREMVGVTLFLGSYETMKQWLAPESNVVTAISGLVAGSLYSGFTYAVDSATLEPQLRAGRSLLPTLLRAAPFNAVLFLGYESTLAHLSHQ